VVLTGMGADGLRGSESVVAAGAGVRPGRGLEPGVGHARGGSQGRLANQVLPLEQIGGAVVAAVTRSSRGRASSAGGW